MEQMVFHTIIAPVLRERLIEKYVPKEPVDPLVYKITAFYWLLQELIGNWKAGKRLAFDQKVQLLQILVWNLSNLAQEQCEPITVRRNGFDYPRESIDISQETTDQIAQLVLACQEFHLKE